MKRSGMELFFTHLKVNGTLQPAKWWSDSEIPVIQCSRVSVLWVVASWTKNTQRDTIHFNADASNTELLFRIIHSVNQLRFFTEQFRIGVNNFGLTEEEKGQEKQKESVTKGVLTSVKSHEEKLLVSSPRQVSGNSLWEIIQDFESLSETVRFTKVCEDASFRHRVAAGMSYKTRHDEDDGLAHVIPLCRDTTRFSRLNTTIQSLCGNSWRNSVWASHWSSDLENLWPDINSIIQWYKTDILWFCWSPEERVGSWMKFKFLIPNSDPVQNYSLNFRKQEENNLDWDSRRLASRRLVRSMFHLCGHPQHSSQPIVLFSPTQNHSHDREELDSYSCQFFVWRSSANSGFKKL